jgi:hypothetical protein
MPELKIIRVDDLAPFEGKAQMHGDRRVAAHLRFLEQTATRVFIHCHYDPGMTIEAHGHASDHAIFVLNGSVTVGEVECPPATLVVLEKGAVFGPLVAGPEGTDLLEFYAGDTTPIPEDPDAFEALLRARDIVPVPVDLPASSGASGRPSPSSP